MTAPVRRLASCRGLMQQAWRRLGRHGREVVDLKLRILIAAAAEERERVGRREASEDKT